MRSPALIRPATLERLSSGLRHRHIPKTSQSVFSRRYSARWEPTIPVMPVIKARLTAIARTVLFDWYAESSNSVSGCQEQGARRRNRVGVGGGLPAKHLTVGVFHTAREKCR